MVLNSDVEVRYHNHEKGRAASVGGVIEGSKSLTVGIRTFGTGGTGNFLHTIGTAGGAPNTHSEGTIFINGANNNLVDITLAKVNALGTGNLTLGTNTNNTNVKMSGFAQTISGLVSTTSSEVSSTSATTLTLKLKDGITTSATTKLTGSLGLTVDKATGATGTGIQVLSGTNTYTGATTINAGTLLLSSTGSTAAASAVSVASDAALGGDGTVGGSATFYNSSIFAWNLSVTDPDNTASASVADTFSVTGSLVDGDTTGGSVFKILLVGTQTFADTFWSADHSWNNVLNSGNSFALENLFTSFSYANAGGTINPGGYGSFSLSGSTLTWNSYSAIPEPTTALAGLLLAAGLLRRRRSRTISGASGFPPDQPGRHP
jgi:autotransporter-associated beta strand protein